ASVRRARRSLPTGGTTRIWPSVSVVPDPALEPADSGSAAPRSPRNVESGVALASTDQRAKLERTSEASPNAAARQPAPLPLSWTTRSHAAWAPASTAYACSASMERGGGPGGLATAGTRATGPLPGSGKRLLPLAVSSRVGGAGLICSSFAWGGTSPFPPSLLVGLQ